MMYIIDHSNGQKILDIDSNYINAHRTGNKLFDLDNLTGQMKILKRL